MFKESWIPTVKQGRYHRFELYDLEADPAQTKNLANEHPEIVNRMAKELTRINDSIMSDGHDWHKKEVVSGKE